MRKMNFKSENGTKVVCPKCGTEFAIADKTHISVGVVIGKDAGLGTIHPKVANEGKKQLPDKAAERIEALREAGVDVSNLFAMMGANGGEYVVSQKDGNISILADDDPIYASILSQGCVPNWKLFRRFVMAKLFRMLFEEQNFRVSITEQIRKMGYDYMWKQLQDEFYAQKQMLSNGDFENFEDRCRWFNADVLIPMLYDYKAQLSAHISKLKVHRCKGVPYKRILGEDVFLSDIDRKIYEPIEYLIREAKDNKKSIHHLHYIVRTFNRSIKKKGSWNPSQCSNWIDAYKGAGVFFTMQNMIRFHECRVYVSGYKLDKDDSYRVLCETAKRYKNEGWRLIGFFRKFLKDNNVDIAKKMAEWQKRK